MANKAKSSKQQKLRLKTKRAQLERLKAQTGNYNMTMDDMHVWRKALADKETPKQYLENGYNDIIKIMDQFGVIVRLRDDEETMSVVKQIDPTLWENVVKAGDFLKEAKTELEEIKETNTEAVDEYDADTNNMLDAVIVVGPIMEGYDKITTDLSNNTMNLMSVVTDILKLYKRIDSMELGNDE